MHLVLWLVWIGKPLLSSWQAVICPHLVGPDRKWCSVGWLYSAIVVPLGCPQPVDHTQLTISRLTDPTTLQPANPLFVGLKNLPSAHKDCTGEQAPPPTTPPASHYKWEGKVFLNVSDWHSGYEHHPDLACLEVHSWHPGLNRIANRSRRLGSLRPSTSRILSSDKNRIRFHSRPTLKLTPRNKDARFSLQPLPCALPIPNRMMH